MFYEFFGDVCGGIKYVSEEKMVTKPSSGNIVPILLLAALSKGIDFVNSFCAHLMHRSEQSSLSSSIFIVSF